MTLCWPWPILWQCQILQLCQLLGLYRHFIQENVTIMDFLEIIAACGLEIGWFSKLNEKIKVYEVPLTLAKHHSDIKIKACCTKKILWSFVTRFCAYHRLRYQVNWFKITCGPGQLNVGIIGYFLEIKHFVNRVTVQHYFKTSCKQ